MPVEIRYSGQTVTAQERKSRVEAKGKSYSIGIASAIIMSDAPTYEGSYEVVPSEERQVLPTGRKTLERDVVVYPIPYPDGDYIGYSGASCVVGLAEVGTGYAWTDFQGEVCEADRSLVDEASAA